MHPGFAEHLRDLLHVHVFGVAEPESLKLGVTEVAAGLLPEMLIILPACEQFRRIILVRQFGNGRVGNRPPCAMTVDALASRNGKQPWSKAAAWIELRHALGSFDEGVL